MKQRVTGMPKIKWLADITAQQLDDARKVAITLGWNLGSESMDPALLGETLAAVWKDDPERSARAVSLVLALLARRDATHVPDVRLLLSDLLLEKLDDERRYPDLSDGA
jgi:hypothetical protein